MDLTSLLARNGYLPHGYCFTWSPGILWTMVAADGLIAAAYFSIPLGILSLARRRPDPRLRGVSILFGAFIFGCGITHLMDIWTVWQPDYALQAVTKVGTAAVSLVTAVAVWRLIPAVVRLPTHADLQRAVTALEIEVGRRLSAQEHANDIERKLAVTLASIEAGLITTDPEGRIVRLNAVAEHLTGWSQPDAAGQSYWDVFVRADGTRPAPGASIVDVVIGQGIEATTPQRVDVVSRAGRRIALEVHLALMRDDDGTVRGALAVLKDMTRLLAAEEAVRRMAAIVESSNDAIIGKSLDGRITSWNRAATALLGYTADEAIGSSVRMLLPPDRMDEEMRVIADIAGGRVVPAFDTVRLRRDGTPIELSVSISPIRDRDGRIVGGSKIARDVTEQHRTLAALRESEGRLRFALEVAGIGDWDLDLETGVMHRSVRHDRCFGYDALQSDWSLATTLAHIHPDDRDDVALAYRRGLVPNQDWISECRVIWPDASVHWIRIHGSTRYETGNSNRMLGIVADMTVRKRAEQAQQLESENRQIQESNRLKSQFLANMSHELRSPLNAIIGFSDLLHADGPPIAPATQRQFIGHIRTSGRHLLQLINDVLDLSKVESGKFEFFPEVVDLAALVEEVNAVLFTQLSRKRLRVTVDIPASLGPVTVDPARLKQALYNYLSNAIKFSPEGGLVTIRGRRDGAAFFRVEVEDAGVGIATADLPRLFVEFQQLDASYTKRHQGTGLGLALTRRLVEAQGGTVGVRSVLGSGSVFHLALPRTTARAAMDDAGGDGVTGLSVLVIERDPSSQTRIAGALAHSGHVVDVASSAEQAVRKAIARSYDALTLDLMLGSPGGFDVLARLRSECGSSGSPVVAITLGARASAMAAFSIADVLAKPLRAPEVVDAMARFGLGRHPGAKVMVIDDDPVALDLMRLALERQGIEAATFLEGRQALQELQACDPAAIILDLMMPGMNGFEVLEMLRESAAWRDVPVFIWTSLVLSDREYDLLALSASAILRKGGGGLDALLERLRRWRPADRVPAERAT